jgi:hypothetical protein
MKEPNDQLLSAIANFALKVSGEGLSTTSLALFVLAGFGLFYLVVDDRRIERALFIISIVIACILIYYIPYTDMHNQILIMNHATKIDYNSNHHFSPHLFVTAVMVVVPVVIAYFIKLLFRWVLKF